MKNNKYKILVLSDLKKNTSSSIKSSISLANMIGGEVTLFNVKKHIDIVEGDNQLSAIRTLNEEHINTKKEIKALIDPIAKEYNVAIDYSYSFGKVKEEIRNYIKVYNPDIIVLGQRDSSPLQLIGDSITRFILKEFKGAVMITANENALVPNEKMTLGIFNDSNRVLNTKFSKDLITHTKAPLKSFKIINSQKEIKKASVENEEKMEEYVFEENTNAMNTLSSYLLKSNINLLCIDRVQDKTKNTAETPLNKIISQLNVSLLVSEA
ncbi:universal stress protein [Lacinutrix sp. Bg11-31]|uniref:universal stress protein n=1 Tax=Lacinutrix sp. Bg11-31 TaxID=2057808 RepID=UPI000C314213|nr:universal stress protein [Lacinutrix sp. Bg11-31]AUC82844.1 universal stress protein [Lacinutrix sp. Bg11-31]